MQARQNNCKLLLTGIIVSPVNSFVENQRRYVNVESIPRAISIGRTKLFVTSVLFWIYSLNFIYQHAKMLVETAATDLFIVDCKSNSLVYARLCKNKSHFFFLFTLHKITQTSFYTAFVLTHKKVIDPVWITKPLSMLCLIAELVG